MKKFIIPAAAALMLSACTDFDYHQEHDTTLSAFSITTSDIDADLTADDVDLEQTLTIEWEKSHAADYSQVFYKVLFSASGDFQHPDYQIEPGKIGIETMLELTNRDLNIIAEAAGIPPNGKGTVKWTVMASNGLAKGQASEVRNLTVSRPDGFAYIPTMVDLTGDDGSYVTLKTLDYGVFEGFVYLSDANYSITDHFTPDRKYGISGPEFKQNIDMPAVNPGKIHHISINFNTAEASVRSVEEVGLWYSGTNSVLETMNLSEDLLPVWSKTFEFNTVDDDLRYKFRFVEKDAAGNTANYFYGYSSKTSRPQTTSSPASYFYLYPEAEPSQSDFCFSFNKSLHAGKTLTITLSMEHESVNYFHTVTAL